MSPKNILVKDNFESGELVVFSSELGWISMMMRDVAIGALSFGHASAAAAAEAIALNRRPKRKLSDWQREVVTRIQGYAAGVPVDFSDLSVDCGPTTDFQFRVLTACREIPYGSTLAYGELAIAAGRPGAARAVGNCMSRNRVPLVVPCHRVVRSGGDIGPYSAAGGSATKRRLLEMEMGNPSGAAFLLRTSASCVR
jgi:methylated-DNA-[protein]-cysteine S-methyltransferase